MQDVQESMQESIDLYITYAQVSEPTLERRAEDACCRGCVGGWGQMLRDMASGSWAASRDFDVWRDAFYGGE